MGETYNWNSKFKIGDRVQLKDRKYKSTYIVQLVSFTDFHDSGPSAKYDLESEDEGKGWLTYIPEDDLVYAVPTTLEKKEDKQNIVYLCDRKQCDNCSYPDCRHTHDINHAVNFDHETYDGEHWEKEEQSDGDTEHSDGPKFKIGDKVIFIPSAHIYNVTSIDVISAHNENCDVVYEYYLEDKDGLIPFFPKTESELLRYTAENYVQTICKVISRRLEYDLHDILYNLYED